MLHRDLIKRGHQVEEEEIIDTNNQGGAMLASRLVGDYSPRKASGAGTAVDWGNNGTSHF